MVLSNVVSGIFLHNEISDHLDDVVTSNSSNATDTRHEDAKICFYVFSIQNLLALLINIATITLILRKKALRRNKSNKLFINLFSVHILESLTGLVSIFYNQLPESVNNVLLLEMFICMIISTADRYMNITYPYKYARVRNREVFIALVTSWILSGLFIIPSFLIKFTKYFDIVVSSILIVATVTLAITNVKIYIIARRHATTIRKNSVTRPDEMSKKRILKSTYVCFSIVISFIILWSPLFLYNMIGLARVLQPDVITCVVLSAARFHPLVDPVLYICFNRDAKREIRRISRGHNSYRVQ